MKKKIALSIGAMTIAAVLGLIFAQSLFVSAGPDLSVSEIEKKITQQYPGTITEIELDEEGKKPIYEVEIEIDGKEYELEIDGNSGEVIKLDKKLVNRNVNGEEKMSVNRFTEATAAEELQAVEQQGEKQVEEKVTAVEAPKKESKQVTETPKKESTPAPKQEQKQEQKQKPAVQEQKPVANPTPKHESKPAKKSIITRDQAIQIALGQFAGKVEDVELGDDDGQLIYEIEIESNRGDADIEIDAYTGKVLVVDIDLDDDDN